MLETRETRRLSLEAKRQRCQSHGWNLSALPLSASIGERLEAKAANDDELGDEADEILSRARDAVTHAWRAAAAARKALPDDVA